MTKKYIKYLVLFVACIILSLLFVTPYGNADNIQLYVSDEYYVEGYGACVDNCHVVNLSEENIVKINVLLKEFVETKTDKEKGDIYYYKRIIIKSNENSILIIMGNHVSYNNKNYTSPNNDLYNYLIEIMKNEDE